MKNSDVAKLLIALDTCKVKNLNAYYKILKNKKVIKENYDTIIETLNNIDRFSQFMTGLNLIVESKKIEGTISIWFDCILGYGFDDKDIASELNKYYQDNENIINQIVEFAKSENTTKLELLTKQETESIELIEQSIFTEALVMISSDPFLSE